MTMTFKTGLTALSLSLSLALGLAAVPAGAQETAPATPAPVTVQDITIGSADAKVKVDEYASYTCPHCADFHGWNWDKLKAEYIDTGKVQFTLHEVYFDRYGLWAAMMARCGGELRYYGIVDILFETQADWIKMEDPNATVENIKKIGRTAGMDPATLDACMKDGAMAQALVDHSEAAMKANGVEGTPTVFINGVKYSNMQYDELKSLIEAELAK